MRISHTCLISAGTVGGVIYSEGSSNDMNFNTVSSTQCIYEINSARSDGSVFGLGGPNILSSENNVYVRNSSPAGSMLLSGGSPFTTVVMAGDVIRNNIGTILEAGDLKNIFINDTQFMNNTSEGPTIFIKNSVTHFTCINCKFRQNVMETEGILSIFNPHQVVLSQLHVKNNNVTIGSMIMIHSEK